MERDALAARWFALTRETLPALAVAGDWPVRFDHCFQRILLDNAAGGPWRDSIAAPAWRNAPDGVLARAVELGEAAAAGKADLALLNRRSLAWRGKRAASP